MALQYHTGYVHYIKGRIFEQKVVEKAFKDLVYLQNKTYVMYDSQLDELYMQKVDPKTKLPIKDGLIPILQVKGNSEWVGRTLRVYHDSELNDQSS
jgi:hypothetical protein